MGNKGKEEKATEGLDVYNRAGGADGRSLKPNLSRGPQVPCDATRDGRADRQTELR